MKNVLDIIKESQSDLRNILEKIDMSGGLTKERYQRFLSMQYHLTNGVQKHFFSVAAHPSFAKKKKLREFLFKFGIEEEPHFQIAEKDLRNLDLSVLPVNLDVKLWWSYFDSVVPSQPLIRLGATCILENISVGAGDLIKKLLGESSFLDPRNTRFIIIHQHEELPHGDEILSILSESITEEGGIDELSKGAEIGRVMYLRMMTWVADGKDSI